VTIATRESNYPAADSSIGLGNDWKDAAKVISGHRLPTQAINSISELKVTFFPTKLESIRPASRLEPQNTTPIQNVTSNRRTLYYTRVQVVRVYS